MEDGEDDDSDDIDEDDEITDDEDDEEWKLVTTCMLRSVNNMNWNIFIDYITRIIVMVLLHLFLYLDPLPYSETHFLHTCF